MKEKIFNQTVQFVTVKNWDLLKPMKLEDYQVTCNWFTHNKYFVLKVLAN